MKTSILYADEQLPDAERLCSLSYISRSCIDSRRLHSELPAMVQRAQSHNETSGVTGALFHRHGCFFQWLEGPAGRLKVLIESIKNDRRHTRFRLTHFDYLNGDRIFTDWAMLGTMVEDADEPDDVASCEGWFEHVNQLAGTGTGAPELLQIFVSPQQDTSANVHIAAFSTSQLWLNPLLSHVGNQDTMPRVTKWYRSTAAQPQSFSAEELLVDDEVLGKTRLLALASDLVASPLVWPLLGDMDALVFLFRHDNFVEKLAWVTRAVDAAMVNGNRPILCVVLPASVVTLRQGIEAMARDRGVKVYVFEGSILLGREVWQFIHQKIAAQAPRPGRRPALAIATEATPAAVTRPGDNVYTFPESQPRSALMGRPEIVPPQGKSASTPPTVAVTAATNLKEIEMANVNASLDEMMQIDGAMGVVLADFTSGMVLGKQGGGVDLDVAAAGNTEVLRSKMKTMKALGINDHIEDILITLGRQFHIIRPLAKVPNLFIYLVLDKSKSNLAMARHKVSAIENALSV
jgi:Sensors of blue-light using FAD